MTEDVRSAEPKAAPKTIASRALQVIGYLGADLTVALIWTALIVALVLFSGVVSQFTYVDF